MCGLVGALVFDDSRFRITAPYLDRMRDTMIHRGPDGAGTWVAPDARVGLAHRRLSIIDLSPAAGQPMASADAGLQLVFNGEIYNHAEIRRELQRLGGGHRRWKTDHSDTEVILHAFEQWGIACLERFRGMFAFALWDDRRRELWLVRDRVGIKPLYYSVHHGRITFASEIKALLADPDQPRAVDERAFFHYLSFLATPGPETLFAGIRKLAGGTWLRVRADGHVSEHRYWDVWDHTEPLVGRSEAEVADRLLAELRTAVSLRKVSDVPVGVFLSGGVDSSTNAALFSEGETAPVRTFTIGYHGEHASYRNETHYARRMAEFVRAEHRELLLSPDHLAEFLTRMAHLQDEPAADAVCMPVYYLSKLARESGVTVCQAGEGADELFWGYPTWNKKRRLERLNRLAPGPLKQLGVAMLALAGQRHTKAYECLRRAARGQAAFWGGAEAFTQAQKQRLLSGRLVRELRGLTSWDGLRPIYERFHNKAWDPAPANWMSHVDLHCRLPELLLMRLDKMSMGVSLEARVPFLDHKVVELAMSIPAWMKIRGGTTKPILKRAVRGLVPDELIDRPKQGFGVPIYEWFLGRLGETVRRELDDFCRLTDFFNPAEVRRLCDERNAPAMWYLLNFALWWKEFVAGAGQVRGSADPLRRAA